LTAVEPVLCCHCGDVIGVYESLVVPADTGARETSIAAESDLPIAGAQCYHLACYSGDGEPPQSPSRAMRVGVRYDSLTG
jgi:hypothetical protein